MRVEFEKMDKFYFAGKKVSTKNPEEFGELCPKLWGEYMEVRSEIEKLDNRFCLGYCTMDCKSGTFDYYAGSTVSGEGKIPEGLEYIEVPSKEYAVFYHYGSPEKLGGTYCFIHEKWIKESGYEVDGDFEFESYDDSFNGENPNDEKSLIKIYLPVKKG